MKIILIFVLAFMMRLSNYGQLSEIVWQECFGSSKNEYCNSITNSDNGYLLAIDLGENITGATNYHGGVDIWIINIDSVGNFIWERCYGGSDGDVPQKLLRNNNGYYICGYTFSTDGDIQSGNNGFSDLWVVKINKQGDIIWENTYGCTGYDEIRDMILTPDGGFVMLDRIGTGGGDVTNFYGIGDVWMCKCNSLGNIEWEKTLGNQGLDNGVSMMINSEGNIIMIGAVQKHGGMVECYPDGAWGDVWIVELDLQGNIISQHCFGGSDYDLGYKIIQTDNGYVFAAITTSNDGDVSGLHGPTGGPPGGWEDIWVVGINEQYEIVWQKCIGGYKSDLPDYITQTEDNGFLIIGSTDSNDGDVSGNHSWPGGYDSDIWVVKLDSIVEIEWQHCYGGYGDENFFYSYAILKKSDFDYVIAASTDNSPSFDVQCDSAVSFNDDAWVFEIKDCNYYASAVPEVPQGADTVCTTENTQTVFTVPPADKALYYEWLLSPEEAGTISGDSLTATVSWAKGFTGTAAVVVRSVNDCGESNWSQPYLVQVYSCIGIHEQQTEGMTLKVYPNPAKDFIIFELQGPKSNGTIRIMNIFGETVATKRVSQDKTAVRFAGLESGIYFYRLESLGKVLSGKFVVRR